MPTSRRSTGGARAKAGPGTNQSTISFASKVSKPTTKDTGKKAIISDQPTHKKPAKVSVSPTATSPKSEPEPVSPTVEEGDDDVDVSPYAEVETPTATEKPEFEIEAGKVSDAQVKKYWKGIEAEGTVKRVHQEDLSVTEKILRYFDMSSEYGPFVGITRMKRWQRAHRLGLGPPIEVLAVLLKEQAKGNTSNERAHADILLNSFVAGSH